MMADVDDFIETPVLPLKEGLLKKSLTVNRNIEFEVIPDSDSEDDMRGTSAESCFDFEAMTKQVNLDVIDIDDDFEDSEDGSPFDKFRRKMHNLTENGYVKKFVVQQGHGPQVPENCVVYLRYQGYFEYQEVPFDSTLMQCEARGDVSLRINLAAGELIPGLHLGVLSMRKGEKAEFLIHPDFAYGKMGCPPRIPPDATVLFVVEIDRFLDCGDIHLNEEDLSMEDRRQFVHVLKKVKSEYLLANDNFKRGNVAQALKKYRLGTHMLHNARLASEDEETEQINFLIKLYSNSCVCNHKLKRYRQVCSAAADSMKVSETKTLNSFKIMYFWGYAKMMLSDHVGAGRFLSKASKLMPRDQLIQEALTMLERRRQESRREEQLMCQRAFNFQPPSTVTITEVEDEQEEKFRSFIKDQLREFLDNPDRDSLLLKERYTKREEEIWVKTAKGLGLYARVVNSNNLRIIEIQKPK